MQGVEELHRRGGGGAWRQYGTKLPWMGVGKLSILIFYRNKAAGGLGAQRVADLTTLEITWHSAPTQVNQTLNLST